MRDVPWEQHLHRRRLGNVGVVLERKDQLVRWRDALLTFFTETMSLLVAWLKGLFCRSPQGSNVAGTRTGTGVSYPRRDRPKRKRDDQIENQVPTRTRRMLTSDQGRTDHVITTRFASTILPLVQNGFLAAADLASLALVCKTINASVMEDQVWAALCCREYPGTNTFGRRFKLRHGHYWLYKRWSAPVVKRRWIHELPPLDPPAFKDHELQFYLHMSYEDCPIFAGKYNAGSTILSSLIYTGGVLLTVVDPIVLGKALWYYPEEIFPHYDFSFLPVTCDSFDNDKLDVRLHVRRGNGKDLCCLFRSQDRKADISLPAVYPLLRDGELPTMETKFDLGREQIEGSIRYEKLSDERLHLQQSRQSNAILHRFPYPVHFNVKFDLEVIDGDVLAITRTSVLAMYEGSRRFNSTETSDSHGVTLLHVLSELQG